MERNTRGTVALTISHRKLNPRQACLLIEWSDIGTDVGEMPAEMVYAIAIAELWVEANKYNGTLKVGDLCFGTDVPKGEKATTNGSDLEAEPSRGGTT